MGQIRRIKERAKALKRETYVLYYACRDARTPWCAKVLSAAVLAYALSPIDLIPDFIPVLGYLDDLVIIPAGIALALRMIPQAVTIAARARADVAMDRGIGRYGALVIGAVWISVAAAVARIIWETMGSP